jgi:apolipoprotein N-acyltransferase
VPEKSEEVKVHAPTEFAGGGRSAAGKLVIKPVAFTPARLKPATTAVILVAVLAVLAITWVAGRAGLFQDMIVTTAGLLIVSPPLVLAAYLVMRNAEFEPYRGRELYLRSALCALAYAALWGIFSLLVARGVIFGEMWICSLPSGST